MKAVRPNLKIGDKAISSSNKKERKFLRREELVQKFRGGRAQGTQLNIGEDRIQEGEGKSSKVQKKK